MLATATPDLFERPNRPMIDPLFGRRASLIHHTRNQDVALEAPKVHVRYV